MKQGRPRKRQSNKGIYSDPHYKGKTFEELEKNFKIQVEKHIADCENKGVPVPFKEK